MDTIFEYTLKTSLDEDVINEPFYSKKFIGDIGDFIEVDGVGYIVIDYKQEQYASNKFIAGRFI